MLNRPLHRLSLFSLLALILAVSSVVRPNGPTAHAEIGELSPFPISGCGGAEVTADYDPAWAGDCDCNSATGSESVIEKDRVRIQAHFNQVEAELRSRDVSHLSPELQKARSQNLDELLVYREAGEFPHNTHVPHRQPVFIDRDDRRCAVGHLMIESGFEDEARRIAEHENLAYLLEMESPEVEEWVAQSGLTAEEAAWIQPEYSACYDGCSNRVRPVCGSDGKTHVNRCFAQQCGDVERWVRGCCADGDQVFGKCSMGGFRIIRGKNGDPYEFCPVGQSNTNPDEDEWIYPGDTDFSDILYFLMSIGPFLAFAAILLIFGVQRRWKLK